MMIRQMTTNADLGEAAVLEAIKMIRAEQRPTSRVGADASEFFEILCAPEAGEIDAAHTVAKHLLTSGVGVKVTVHWPYKGTRLWAVKSGDLTIINRGA